MAAQTHNTRDDPRQMAWSALIEGYNLAYKSIAVALKGKTELTLEEYDLLLSVSRACEGRMRLSHLAQAAVLSRGGVTRMVDRLIERGLLERGECSEDKRGAFAVLTNKGKSAMRAMWPAYSAAISTTFSRHITDTEAVKLRELLERVIGGLREPAVVPVGSIGRRRR